MQQNFEKAKSRQNCKYVLAVTKFYFATIYRVLQKTLHLYRYENSPITIITFFTPFTIS